jgi:hypothetical protein
VRLRLDRRAAGFDEIVIGAREPAKLAAAITRHAGLSPAARAA